MSDLNKSNEDYIRFEVEVPKRTFREKLYDKYIDFLIWLFVAEAK